MHTHVQVCWHVCEHVCGHICGQVPRALLAGGVCEGDMWKELVALYRSCLAEQTHIMEVLVGTASTVASSGKGNRTRYLQVTPTKAPTTKPRAHAVSHGQTIVGGVWLRPFLGNASLFTGFFFTIFVPLDPPPPNQQSDGFPLEFLLKGPETELRTLCQNCVQTLQKMRTTEL